MIILIDNYDSFTYNVYQSLGRLGEEIQVYRNDAITLETIEVLNPTAIVLSPGPKTPLEAGICIELIQRFYNRIPILGICLGHQSIGAAFSGTVTHAATLFHGKVSTIEVDEDPLFQGIPSVIDVARYHSLIVSTEGLPEMLKPLSIFDGEIMAMRHVEYPLYGLQFHPESIMTPEGDRIIENFVQIAREHQNVKEVHTL